MHAAQTSVRRSTRVTRSFPWLEPVTAASGSFRDRSVSANGRAPISATAPAVVPARGRGGVDVEMGRHFIGRLRLCRRPRFSGIAAGARKIALILFGVFLALAIIVVLLAWAAGELIF